MTDQQAVFYRESDVDKQALAGQTVTVVGYGNLGRSMALNLRDSGLPVVVGNIDDAFRARAVSEGFEPLDIGTATARGDVVYALIPDEVIPEVFRDQIEPNLRQGAAVAFGSGYVLAYGLVKPPAHADVLLIAPRMLGEEVRHTYQDGSGYLSYVNVEQDATGTAQQRLLALASGAGSLARGAIQLTAVQEATLDLFVEQSVGPYLGTAFQLAFQVGSEAGLPPEAIVAELYLSGEMPRTIKTMADVGFYQSVTWHGLVATYGGFLGTQRLDFAAMEKHFRDTLELIRSGGFARKLQDEEAGGYPTLAAIESITKVANPLTDAENRFKAALSTEPVAG